MKLNIYTPGIDGRVYGDVRDKLGLRRDQARIFVAAASKQRALELIDGTKTVSAPTTSLRRAMGNDLDALTAANVFDRERIVVLGEHRAGFVVEADGDQARVIGHLDNAERHQYTFTPVIQIVVDEAADPDGEHEQHHGDRCDGAPVFETDGAGQWTARCSTGTWHQDGAFRRWTPCGWEVTGCETRREAGARFYGGEDPELYGNVPADRTVPLGVANAVVLYHSETPGASVDQIVEALRGDPGSLDADPADVQAILDLLTQSAKG